MSRGWGVSPAAQFLLVALVVGGIAATVPFLLHHSGHDSEPVRVERYRQGCDATGPARSVPPVDRTASAWTGPSSGPVPARLVEVTDYDRYRNPPVPSGALSDYSGPVSLPAEWRATGSRRAVLTVCEYLMSIGEETKNCSYTNREVSGPGQPSPLAPGSISVRRARYHYQVFESRTGRLLTEFDLNASGSEGACPGGVPHAIGTESVPSPPSATDIGSEMDKLLVKGE